jgi:hypothetical protein
MNEQILIQLQGGLGNQLFQYAAALAVQRESNSYARLFSITTPNKHNHLNHDYGKDIFLELEELPNLVLNDSCKYVQANAFERWNPKLLPSSSLLILSGYFQYFPAIKDVIHILQQKLLSRLLLACRTPRILPNSSQSAFLHVRRGDYLNHPTYHWSQTMDYYKKGIDYVEKHNAFIYKWYVFSDDIEWCKSQPLFQKNTLEFIEEPDEYHALSMMIQCQGGAVIANSTFSWWGAILGSHYSKSPVVYPLKWCGEETVILFPQEWRGF